MFVFALAAVVTGWLAFLFHVFHVKPELVIDLFYFAVAAFITYVVFAAGWVTMPWAGRTTRTRA